MQELTFQVNEDEASQRLDLCLIKSLTAKNIILSRTAIQHLIKENYASVNGKFLKPNYKVKFRDLVKVTIPPAPDITPAPENIPLEIIYEDNDILVLNKPAGLVVHPAPGNKSGTLVNALLRYTNSLSSVSPSRPGIVHRLDKDTSGVMVVAKNNPSHIKLSRQFQAHKIRRIYWAIVKGRVEFDEGEIDLPIGRHPLKRKNMRVAFTKDSKKAKTRYRVIQRFNNTTLLELSPQTGRTHQIRVHLAALGHPILGDKKYGNPDYKRLCLHAKTLGLKHPATGKFMEFDSEVPDEMQSLIQKYNM